MRSIRTLYLTGPQFGAHAELTLQAEASALCAAAGFELAIPDPDTLKEEEASEALAREIYAQRVSCLRRADAVIVDLTPLRGPAAEPTAAFEAGFAAGLGRPVFAYLTCARRPRPNSPPGSRCMRAPSSRRAPCATPAA